jgi:hypothetical protein
MWKVIKDWRMIVLLPMFFASNYFYAYVSLYRGAGVGAPCTDYIQRFICDNSKER